MQKITAAQRFDSASLARLSRTLGVVPVRLWLVMVLLLAFVVRIVALNNSDLWLDEAISFFIAEKPLGKIVLYTASHVFEHPPGYYMLLHLWMGLAGTEEFALRFLSAFGGMLTVALSAALARRWFSNRGGIGFCARLTLLVALLMALQPTAVYVGREVRMYAWMMTLALLSIHALDRAFLRNRWRDWGLFLVTIGLSVLFHYLAGLFVIAYALFVVLFWRKLPAGRGRLAAILAVIFGLAGAWVFTQAGPRDTLLNVLSESSQISRFVASLVSVCTHWVLGNGAHFIAPLPASILALLAWFPVAISIVGMMRLRPAPRPADESFADGDLRQRPEVLHWLIILLLLAPPALRALLSSLPNVRHSAMMTGILVLCTALGILALFRRSHIAGVLMLVTLLSLDGVLLVRELRSLERPFSVPLAYIQDRARDDEPVVYTHPLDWPQNTYYNQRNLPAYYIPETLQPITEEAARVRAVDLLAHTSSVWLILFPSLLEPERIERAFNEIAFPAEKVWFSGGRSVIHYFSARSSTGEDLRLEEYPGGLIWNDQIRLNRWAVASRRVAAGDALRLQFEWQRVAAVTQRSLVVLTLVGPDDTIWAKRVGAPCNGLCPTSDFGDEPTTERQAFYVPADMPPGTYELRIAWATEDGAPILGRAEDASAESSSAGTSSTPGDSSGSANSSGSGESAMAGPSEVDLLLSTVQVMEPTGADAINAPLSRPLHSAAGPGLTLLGADFEAPSLRAGQALMISTQWRVTARQPALDVRLVLEQPKHQTQIVQPLGSMWYPVQTWVPGRTIRAQSSFVIPGDLPAGEYNVTLSVVEVDTAQVRGQAFLGVLQVVDRPRTFELPELGTALDIGWGNSVRLARIQVPERTIAGESLQMRLVWQADGPTERNWKVFIHLVDADGVVRAQGDAYPLNGEALTTTWQKGEVIVDAYTISLPLDVPAASYIVRLGFYDESTGERLLLTDGSDALILPDQLEVDAPADAPLEHP